MKIHTQLSPFRGDLEIWLFDERLGSRAFARNITFDAVDNEGVIVTPTAYMSLSDAQELANTLWNSGIRPEQSKQSQGAHEAQGRHLEDMRSLAFAKLNVERP